MKKPVIFDGRNLYDISQMKEKGFYYNSVGRETIAPLPPKGGFKERNH
jgi:UDPglucose 6-dehydrogenase